MLGSDPPASNCRRASAAISAGVRWVSRLAASLVILDDRRRVAQLLLPHDARYHRWSPTLVGTWLARKFAGGVARYGHGIAMSDWLTIPVRAAAGGLLVL